MPLVQDKRIYCFYSYELITELVRIIGERFCLEIGAGDGTLSRFLRDRGVNIIATGDYSWSHAITYPATVENLGAKQALAKFQPRVVVCSWPPPANTFENQFFLTKSAELYIVIRGRNKSASGNWKTFEAQDGYCYEIDEKLSSYVIPSELDSAVILF